MRFAAALLLIVPLQVAGGSFEKDFAVVFIDAATETNYGPIPLDRALLARAIERLAVARARGVVLKFFLDRPKTEDGDRRLSEALASLPVVLQARIDEAERTPNPLLDRFTLLNVQATTGVSGKSGWIPLQRFSERAYDIGFVDFASLTIPILETYRGRTVKSLVLCAVELAAGRRSIIQPARSITIGKNVLKLDARNQFVVSLRGEQAIQYIPFHALLDGTVPHGELEGKVVVLAYDGPNIHAVTTPIGTVKAHRLFIYVLRSVYEDMAPNQALQSRRGLRPRG